MMSSSAFVNGMRASDKVDLPPARTISQRRSDYTRIVTGAPESFDARLGELLRGHGIECTVDANGVWMPGEGMRAVASMFWREGGFARGQLDCALEVWPGRLIVESFAALGETREAALASAFEAFAQNVLHVWLAAFVNPRDERAARETWVIDGKKRPVVHGHVGIRGAREHDASLSDWVPRLRHHVEAQSLDPGLHTLRFFYAQSSGDPLAHEALLDNEPWEPVQSAMKGEVLPAADGYLSVRLFAVIHAESGMDVRRAAALIAARGAGGADDGELVEALIARGAGKLEAERLSAFIPHAFGRVLLRGLGVRARDDRAFVWQGHGKEPREIRLADEPIFVAAERYAEAVQKDGPRRLFDALALRSAEVNAVNGLLQKGGRPEDIGLTGPVFMRLDGPAGARGERPSKPWWKVW